MGPPPHLANEELPSLLAPRPPPQEASRRMHRFPGPADGVWREEEEEEEEGVLQGPPAHETTRIPAGWWLPTLLGMERGPGLSRPSSLL
jgi:hypothetical protein